MTNSRRLFEIDGLRAIAIIVVFVGHAGLPYTPTGTGVTLFFVISGYVITRSLLHELQTTSGFSIKNFYARRFYKIFPPFFIIIVVPSVTLAVFSEVKIQKLFSQVFFYYNWQYILDGSNGILSGSGVVWSLSIEEQFYVAIALVWLLIVKQFRKHPKVILLCIYIFLLLTSILSRFIISMYTDNQRNEWDEISRITFGTDTRMGALAIGGLIAVAASTSSFERRISVRILQNHIIFPLIAGALYLISNLYRDQFFQDVVAVLLQEVSFGMIILYVLSTNASTEEFFLSKPLKWKFVQVIGKSSYSIYLSHQILIIFVKENLYGLELTDYLFNILYFFGCCVILITGIFLHYVSDKPFESKRSSFR